MNYYGQNQQLPAGYPPAGYPPAPIGQSLPAGYPPMQAGGSYSVAPGGLPNWATQYRSFGQDPMYAQCFAAGDFTRTGFLDEAGLQAALAAAGETSLDPETIEMMIMMFDADNNHRIDYNEFSTLMGYLNSMKGNYATAAANSGGAVGSRDISAIMNNTAGGYMNNIGGNDVVERGILPTVNPSAQGFYSLGNFIKIAVILGLLMTLYERNKLPFFNNNNQQQQAGGNFISQPMQQQQAGYGGVPSNSFLPASQYGMPTQGQQKSHGLLGRIFSGFGGRS